MAKAADDTEAGTTDTTRAKTRAVARTKTSETRAKANEGELAEATKSDPIEIAEEPLANTTDTEAAETTEDDAGTMTEHVIRTESEEYNVANQKLEFEHYCGLLLSRYAPSDSRRSERLFETVAGEPLFFSYQTVGRDDFRERHSGSVGTCQDVLCELHCLFDENGRTPSQPRQNVFQAD